MDIFSSGCVFYYVLSGGRHPFGDQYRQQGNILAGEYDLEKIINSECKYLSKKCAPLVYLPVLLQESKFASRNMILKSCAVYTTSSLFPLRIYELGAGKEHTREWETAFCVET